MSKEAKEVAGKRQQEVIKQAVEDAQEEGFPTDIEEREAYFMKEVAEGESKIGDGTYRSKSRSTYLMAAQAQTLLALL